MRDLTTSSQIAIAKPAWRKIPGEDVFYWRMLAILIVLAAAYWGVTVAGYAASALPACKPTHAKLGADGRLYIRAANGCDVAAVAIVNCSDDPAPECFERGVLTNTNRRTVREHAAVSR